MIWVTPQSRLTETLQSSQARHLVTFVSPGTEPVRPDGLAPADHLVLVMNDITVPRQGLILPQPQQVAQLLAFADALSGQVPLPAGPALVVTCYAGISRSTAAAYILACRHAGEGEEMALAQELRRRAPFATPNARLIALGDELLACGGRMSAAIDEIGRGAEAHSGVPFEFPIVQ